MVGEQSIEVRDNDDHEVITETSGEEERLVKETTESSVEVTEEDIIERLTAELEQAKSELQLYKDRWIRGVAEFENYKKRVSREFGEIVRGANEELLKQLLSILDNFDRALTHVEQSEETEGNTDAFRKGIELIAGQFRGILEKNGLQSIPALGEPFDPHLHEAMMQKACDQYASGTVIEVLEQGYRLNERVLRHARVIVSQ